MDLIFNNRHLPDFITITSYDYSLFPEVSLLESETHGKLGNYDGGVDRGKVIHTFSLMLYDKDKPMYEMKRELKKWAKGDNWNPSIIESSEFPGKYMIGRVGNSAQLSDLFTHGEVDIELHCSNPVEYDIEETIISIPESEEVEVNYEGLENAPTELNIELLEDSDTLTFENYKTGFQTTLRASMRVGDTISIDSDRKVVHINNNKTMKALVLDSRWIYLEEGINTLKVTKESGEALRGIFELKYRKAD